MARENGMLAKAGRGMEAASKERRDSTKPGARAGDLPWRRLWDSVTKPGYALQ
jgi:hypothetical protein